MTANWRDCLGEQVMIASNIFHMHFRLPLWSFFMYFLKIDTGMHE